MLHCTMTGGWATEAGKEERKLCHPHFQMGTWGELYLRTHRKTGQRVRLCSELHPGVLGDVLSSRSVLSTPLPSWAFTTQCSSLTQLLSDIGWSHHCEQVLLCSCNKLECVCVLKIQEYRWQVANSTDHHPSDDVLWDAHTPGNTPLVSNQLFRAWIHTRFSSRGKVHVGSRSD